MHLPLSSILSLLTVATTITATHQLIHERRNVAQPFWAKQSRVPGDHILSMSIALKQQNLHLADELVNDVAHPDSPNYGKHWSAKQVIDTFAPSAATVEAVKKWLATAGIAGDSLRLSTGRNWIKFNATVEQAEDLLSAEYHLFQHATEDKVTVACDSYSLPSELKDHIDLVTPTVHLSHMNPAGVVRRGPSSLDFLDSKLPRSDNSPSSRPPHLHRPPINHMPMPKHPQIEDPFTSTANCSNFITPICLRALYDFPVGSTAVPGNSLGIVEFTPHTFAQKDLNMFFANVSANEPKIPQNTAPNVISIDGGVIDPNAIGFGVLGESNLDISYGTAIVFPQSVTVFQTGDPVEGASFNNLLDAFDGGYCTFDGGDTPGQDGIYPDPLPGGFDQPETVSHSILLVKKRTSSSF
jgi:tripeptidyl-peptidase I